MNYKNILITGAARGIGRTCALHLSSLGANVAICCKNNNALLEALADNIRQAYGTKVCTFTGDMGVYEDALAFYAKACDALGGVDVVINNAGISYVGLLQDMSPDEWNRLISTNLTSVYNMCHAAIPSMVHKKYGRIINISSMWGISGASCEAAYSASKGAVNAFTKALGKELAPSGIQVNAIAFGAVDTDMNKCFSKEELENLAEDIPAGRLCSPDEAARMVEMLLNAPDYMNAEVIKVDGGFL